MAKPNTNSTISSPILRDFLSLCLLFLAAFTCLSLYSFSSSDPSLMTVSNHDAKNLGGIIGSHWSALLLQVFGAASFMQAVIFLLAGIALFRKISRKEWLLACLNFFFLLIATSAFFGLTKHTFSIGDAKIPMGGLVGSLLGGLLHSYLNTAGAALLTAFLFIFAVSLSTKISVQNMARFFWLAISKSSLFLAGVFLYSGMQLWAATGKAYDSLKPLIAEWASSSYQQLSKIFQRSEEKPKELIPNLDAPILNTENVMLPSDGLQSFTAEKSSPEIITDKNKLTSDAELIFNKVENKPDENKTGIMQFMRKASSLGKHAAYKLPPLSFLETPLQQSDDIDEDELKQKSQLIEEKLAEHKIPGNIEAVKYGPVVTMYEFKPGAGVKVNSIESRSDDLAMGLSAQSVRIVAPIPGRDVVGIEVPNRKRKSVLLKEILSSEGFQSKNHSIPIAIGKDIFGKPQTADLKKMPHLLVAGTTGSGKSVFINTLLASLLYRFSPDELKLILIDPKQIELAGYNDIPHLLLPVVTEPRKASLALGWAVQEMERRYKLIAKTGVRDIESFNQKFDKIGAEEMTKLVEAPAEKMPKLVIIIDELADLMMTAKADVENNICRIAQKARAAGMHLVLATQRPSADVVTGLIKANLPSRICFKVSSKIDSRVIFETGGAEKLLGQGDMLYMPPGDSRLVRMHGAYLRDEEIDQITHFWKSQGKPNYREDILIDLEEDGSIEDGMDSSMDTSDPIYHQALDIAYSSGAVSASYLQRRLRIGYNKAARFVELMEAQGVVGPAEGSKPRPVLSPRP